MLWSSFSSASFSKLASTVYRDPAPKDPVDTLLSHTKVSKKIYESISQRYWVLDFLSVELGF